MSIRRKLLLAAVVAAGLAALLLSGAAFVKETADWREEKTDELRHLAEIMTDYLAPDLAANDAAGVAETLRHFVQGEAVSHGAVYDPDGRLLAAMGEFPVNPASEVVWHEADRAPTGLTMEARILEDGAHVATVYFAADLSALYADMISDGIVTLLAVLFTAVLAVVFLLRMQRGVTEPIKRLSETMHEVAQERNYSARAVPPEAEEIALLARSFNAMLEAIEERDAELGRQQEMLKHKVEERTAELSHANARLEGELRERKAAQEELRDHDAMLKTVTRAAEDLLGALQLDDAIADILELTARTLGSSQVHLSKATTDRDGHLRMQALYEWCSPGLEPLISDPAFQDFDITADMPHAIPNSLLGEPNSGSIDVLPAAMQEKLRENGIHGILAVPVSSEGRFWGSLVFMDSDSEIRKWTWAETDTLKTLSRLLGVAISRARIVKELGDANTIVQNSPTILYRLKGEPSLPLTYISHNITKFGYEPGKLIGTDHFLLRLVHRDDREKVREAMAGAMSRDVQTATIEFRLVQPTGGFRWVENRYTPVRDESGRLVEIEGIIVDITERKAAEDKVARMARTDSLTGLANRATFMDRLRQTFAGARRGAPRFAVLYLDLDHFKDVNDTRGHPTGDALLCEAANRLTGLVRETDLVARLGGDEFAVIQANVEDVSDTSALADKICEALGAPFLIDGDQLHIGSSVGVSLYDSDTADPDAMLTQADLALYRAKEEGRRQFRFHSDELDRQVSTRVALTDELRVAIDDGQIRVHYQPQVELIDGRIVGMEALVRWSHPERGILTPADFIPIAEKSGLIHPLGHFVLDSACRQMVAWQEEGIAPPVIAVNVSLMQLKTGSQFVKDVLGVLEETGLDPNMLELDVTESMLAQATLAQNDVLDRLQQAGVRVALDHFGTEYSSFDYLRTYSVSHLKVAREFIQRATEDSKQAATIRAIISMARDLGIQVIAEGVETKEQRALLVSLGATTQGQGFYFSKPVAADTASELLRHRTIEGTAGKAQAG